MKTYLTRSKIFCVVLIALSTVGLGQSVKKEANDVTAKKGNFVLNMTGKVAVIIVKSAAKTAWVTTKFAAKDLAKPILFKLLPIVTKFTLRATGVAAKRLLPHAAKLAIL